MAINKRIPITEPKRLEGKAASQLVVGTVQDCDGDGEKLMMIMMRDGDDDAASRFVTIRDVAVAQGLLNDLRASMAKTWPEEFN